MMNIQRASQCPTSNYERLFCQLEDGHKGIHLYVVGNELAANARETQEGFDAVGRDIKTLNDNFQVVVDQVSKLEAELKKMREHEQR